MQTEYLLNLVVLTRIEEDPGPEIQTEYLKILLPEPDLVPEPKPITETVQIPILMHTESKLREDPDRVLEAEIKEAGHR